MRNINKKVNIVVACITTLVGINNVKCMKFPLGNIDIPNIDNLLEAAGKLENSTEIVELIKGFTGLGTAKDDVARLRAISDKSDNLVKLVNTVCGGDSEDMFKMIEVGIGSLEEKDNSKIIMQKIYQSILFSADKDIEASVQNGKLTDKTETLVFFVHGMGDTAEKFFNNFNVDDLSIEKKNDDVVLFSIAYNGQNFDTIDGSFTGLVNLLGNKNYNIIIASYSQGGNIGLRFGKILKEKNPKAKINYVMYKNYTNVLDTPFSQAIVTGLGKVFELLNIGFLKDVGAQNHIKDLTDNYKKLKELKGDVVYEIKKSSVNDHIYSSQEMCEVINDVLKKIKKDNSKTYVNFVYSENDEMVGDGCKRLYEMLTEKGSGRNDENTSGCCCNCEEN